MIWRSSSTNPATAVIGGLLGVVACLAWVTGRDSALSLGPGVAAIVLVAISRLTVTVHTDAVSVRWGPWGFPRHRLWLDDIADVQAVAIRPLHVGGWGYRGSRLLAGRAAAMVRRGPALRFELPKGRVFVVTVDDAPTGATRIQELIGATPP